MTVDIIIVHYKDIRSLETCLTALAAQTLLPQRVLIVDNSHDLPVLSKAELTIDVLRPESNLGFAAACNLAAREAKSEWLALLNADAFPEKTWLEMLCQCAKDSASSYLSSKQLIFEDPSKLDGSGDSYYLSGLYRRRGYQQSAQTSYPKDAFSASGTAMMIKRQLFIEQGGFDTRFFTYGEDVDLGFRLRLQGYRCCYCEQAIVYHQGYQSSGGKHSDFSLYYGHRNLVWVFFKNMPKTLLLILLPLHLFINLITLVKFSLSGHGAVIFRAKWDALKGLPEILKSRRDIQSKRSISLKSLWQSFEKSLL